MSWEWLLKYSSLFITGAITFAVSYLIHFLTQRRANLIYYLSHTQFVPIPTQQGQVAVPILPNAQAGATHIATSTLYVQNIGKAAARDVMVGHFNLLPALGVFPDVPREIVNLPGGGRAIRFPSIPPGVLITISYLFFPPLVNLDQIVSYVTFEDGIANRIPVLLQRVWPNWWVNIIRVLLVAGLWVAINASFSLIKFFWAYHH